MNTSLIIKNLRSASGLSQAGFAEKFDIPLITLQAWEQGRRKPPEYVLKMMHFILCADLKLKEAYPNYKCVACDPEGVCGLENAVCNFYTCNMPSYYNMVELYEEDYAALDDQEGA